MWCATLRAENLQVFRECKRLGHPIEKTLEQLGILDTESSTLRTISPFWYSTESLAEGDDKVYEHAESKDVCRIQIVVKQFKKPEAQPENNFWKELETHFNDAAYHTRLYAVSSEGTFYYYWYKKLKLWWYQESIEIIRDRRTIEAYAVLAPLTETSSLVEARLSRSTAATTADIESEEDEAKTQAPSGAAAAAAGKVAASGVDEAAFDSAATAAASAVDAAHDQAPEATAGVAAGAATV